MNDIYEYKARKYKYKYLKLKREYITEGGAFRDTLNKIGYRIGVDLVMKERDQSKPIDHSQSASSEQKKLKNKLKYLRKEIELYMNNPNLIYGNIYYKDMLYHLEEDGKYTQTHFNNFSDYTEIDNVRLIIDDNRRLIFRGKKRFSIFIPVRKDNYMNYIYENIFNESHKRYDDPQYISHAPPILTFFFDIFKKIRTVQENDWKDKNKNRDKDSEFNNMSTHITKKELFDKLKNEETSLEKFENDLKESLKKPSTSELDKIYTSLKKPFISLNIFKDFVNFFNEKGFQDTYLMKDIFDSIIVKKEENPYVKNIDYYSLAMIINYIYTKFIKYFPIVEDTTKSSKRLPELFENLVKQYNDNKIEKVSFLEQFDKILSVIKD